MNITTKAGTEVEVVEVAASDLAAGDAIIAYGRPREIGRVTVFVNTGSGSTGRYAPGNLRFVSADNGSFLANGCKPTKTYLKVV